MTIAIKDTVDHGIDFDIEDILAEGLPERRILLAALLLAEHTNPALVQG